MLSLLKNRVSSDFITVSVGDKPGAAKMNTSLHSTSLQRNKQEQRNQQRQQQP
jgi:hypothetical protein